MRTQLNKIYLYLNDLAKSRNHKVKIISFSHLLEHYSSNEVYVVPNNEIHFVKFPNETYFIFHKDNNFNFDKRLLKKININDINLRIKLFFQDSLNMKLNENFNCCVCMETTAYPHTCPKCNAYICRICKIQLIQHNKNRCPKCRNDLTLTETYKYIIS